MSIIDYNKYIIVVTGVAEHWVNLQHFYYYFNRCDIQYTQVIMVTWVTKKKFDHLIERSPKAYGYLK